MKRAVFVMGALVSGLLFVSQPAQAEEFNMNFIISDAEFTDVSSMSAEKIQQFLDLQPGILKSYAVTTADGVTKTAARVIYDAAQKYSISPRVLLTNIQKESSMLTRSVFTNQPASYYLDRIVFYSWCDSCSDVRPEFKGFENQINYSTAAFRRYLDQIAERGYTISGWGPNITKNIDCLSSDQARSLCTTGSQIQITPINSATSALYTYTPHPGGNKSFWTLWNAYNFGFRRTYPDGSLLKAKGGSTVYLIQDGLKRPFVSTAAFVSRYSYKSVITVSPDELFFYDQGRNIRFANYSLLRSPKGSIYLLVDDKLRNFTTWAAFRTAGFSREEIVKASDADLADYELGEKITTENIYPSGRLMQNKKTGIIWFVKDGIRHVIPSKQVYASQFGKRKPIPTKEAVLETYEIGSPVGFKDGELIKTKSQPTVYFISKGTRRPIAGWEAAKAYQFDRIWSNIIVTNEAALNAHPLGDPITSDVPPVQIASQ